jgi:hypothetical protein
MVAFFSPGGVGGDKSGFCSRRWGLHNVNYATAANLTCLPAGCVELGLRNGRIVDIM